MTRLTVDTAFAAYEAVRGRLPKVAERPAPPEIIASLADIAERFDVFLLDAFGVLNIGETAIPGTPKRVRDFQAAGKRVLIVSNAAGVPRSDLQRKYARLGYDFALDDIITSRAAAIAAGGYQGNARWGVMGLDRETLEDFGRMEWELLGDDPSAYARSDAFLLTGAGDWTPARQAMLEATLKERPREVRVANPDIVAPREDGFSTEPGFYAHQLADRSGISPRFFGKPFTNIYDLAFARLGPVDRSRVVMVGDSLHTDILGGHAAGIASVLIAGYGFFAGHDAPAAIATSGIAPDFIAACP